MGRTNWALAVACIGASTGVADAQQAAHPSIQQAFEAATALDSARDYAGALAAWQALEPRVAPNRRSHALVLVRKATTLLALGRVDEAAVAA